MALAVMLYTNGSPIHCTVHIDVYPQNCSLAKVNPSHLVQQRLAYFIVAIHGKETNSKTSSLALASYPFCYILRGSSLTGVENQQTSAGHA